jgi:hypothetical protein
MGARRGAVTVAEAGAAAWMATARFPQGRGQGHEGGGRGKPGNMRNDVAHRGGRPSVRWRGEAGTAASRWRRTAHEVVGDPASTL